MSRKNSHPMLSQTISSTVTEQFKSIRNTCKDKNKCALFWQHYTTRPHPTQTDHWQRTEVMHCSTQTLADSLLQDWRCRVAAVSCNGWSVWWKNVGVERICARSTSKMNELYSWSDEKLKQLSQKHRNQNRRHWTSLLQLTVLLFYLQYLKEGDKRDAKGATRQNDNAWNFDKSKSKESHFREKTTSNEAMTEKRKAIHTLQRRDRCGNESLRRRSWRSEEGTKEKTENWDWENWSTVGKRVIQTRWIHRERKDGCVKSRFFWRTSIVVKGALSLRCFYQHHRHCLRKRWLRTRMIETITHDVIASKFQLTFTRHSCTQTLTKKCLQKHQKSQNWVKTKSNARIAVWISQINEAWITT